MPANQYGIDLGEVYRTAAAVKGARAQNALAQLKRQEAEQTAKRRNLASGLREKAVVGDKDAERQLIALDPEGGQVFLDAVGKMDKRQIEVAKRMVDQIGQMSHFVLSGKTPEEQAARYERMRGSLREDVRARIPEEFDPMFMELSLAKAIPMEKALENASVTDFGEKQLLQRHGRVIGEAKRPVKATKGTASGTGGLKSADESLMYRQAAELLGGIFDQDGKITNLDPQARNKVQAIAAEAAKIYQRRGNISRSEAVQLAGKKFGLDIPAPEEIQSTTEPMGNDPLGIR